MNFTSELNARAREIREEAAKRFGGVAEDYNWNEAVSLACKGFEFKNNMSLEEKVMNCSEVSRVKEWKKGNIRRLYITLKGAQRSYRGDNTFQLFIENNELVQKYGKGMTSNTFDESLAMFNAELEANNVA